MREVYVGVPSIAQCFKVHRQVEVVKATRVGSLDHLEHIHLVEPHWDVPDHYCRHGLLVVKYGEKVDLVLQRSCARHVDSRRLNHLDSVLRLVLPQMGCLGVFAKQVVESLTQVLDCVVVRQDTLSFN